ncbi:MAG: acetyltransferase [Dehalococcoidia bacterium]|nr:acetyltransferase [Dehalococcoidia bacterium]
MSEVFEHWAILELMGHIRLGGKVTEEQRFGGTMGRIDIPDGNGGLITQYFGANAVFRLTPTTEDIARMVADRSMAAPIHSWEFPQLRQAQPGTAGDDLGEW